jgi:hypothetical protein
MTMVEMTLARDAFVASWPSNKCTFSFQSIPSTRSKKPRQSTVYRFDGAFVVVNEFLFLTVQELKFQ